MSLKHLNEVKEGDTLIRKSNGEVARVTSITRDGVDSRHDEKVFHFKGYLVNESVMRKFFKNNDGYFKVI